MPRRRITIDALPDDMLHEIFGHLLAGKPKKPLLWTHRPPEGVHAALRCVCRRWRDIADWVHLSTSLITVDTTRLADAGAFRARHPAAFKKLVLACSVKPHSTTIVPAASSLINGSADLRRSLLFSQIRTCCLASISPVLTPLVSCTALTKLILFWGAHKCEGVVPSNMLAPLSALRMLNTLSYGHANDDDGALPASAVLAPLPALPDAPRLTWFCMEMAGNFVPVGSDAALGRLRRLTLTHRAPVQELLDEEDPFLLRTAFDAGTWQPSRLTGLQELEVTFGTVCDARAPVRPSPTGSRAGSEWAPLADQVTSLSVEVKSVGYKRPSTGIVAGLGALTALRSLGAFAIFSGTQSGFLEILHLERVRAPHLTVLESNGVSAPVSVARFPNLVFLLLESNSRQPPLNLRSLVVRSNLTALQLGNSYAGTPDSINLAELFVGGEGCPVLERLELKRILLEWDTTGLSGAPTAAEFAERVRQLLPVLVDVEIHEPTGRNVLPDRSRVGFVVECRRHVVPALEGLHAGGK